MKKKIKAAWGWLRKNVLNKDNLIGAVIAEIIFWSPLLITALFATLFSSWWWAAFWAIIAFWAGPFTPAIPLQLGLIVAVNKLLKKLKKEKKK